MEFDIINLKKIFIQFDGACIIIISLDLSAINCKGIQQPSAIGHCYTATSSPYAKKDKFKWTIMVVFFY